MLVRLQDVFDQLGRNRKPGARSIIYWILLDHLSLREKLIWSPYSAIGHLQGMGGDGGGECICSGPTMAEHVYKLPPLLIHWKL